MGEVIAFPAHRAAQRDLERAAPASISSAPRVAPATLPPPPPPAPRPEPLWREVAGNVLRDERQRQHRTLAQVAERAGMSVQYLSELERGRKEASSEMLAAACGSLGLTLAGFARRCADLMSSVAARPSGPVLLAA